ncbi:unnamed protein product [Allacma fusca]|uniref:Uncharacterized protein n=1 Tax=Allacma fusca TaxID=39272 RepID=A0A8J2KWZ7_9HEXA|nr:unnamed protein product [Allacma fusca]
MTSGRPALDISFDDNFFPPSLRSRYIRTFLKTRSKRYPAHLDLFAQKPQFWMKTGECPSTPDGSREYFCPTPTVDGMWACVDDYQLCDGVKNCPQAEDENPTLCLFYHAVESQINVIAGSVADPALIANNYEIT